MTTAKPPVEIESSLNRFRNDHPDASRTAFIMMQFGHTEARRQMVEVIKNVLKNAGIVGLRADDKQYHDDLFANIVTYMFGCGMGIAVFERTDAAEFNPNVSLEVGYMLALGKPVCFLKDSALKTLHADLVGKLYIQFLPEIPKSISSALEKWLLAKGFPSSLFRHR